MRWSGEGEVQGIQSLLIAERLLEPIGPESTLATERLLRYRTSQESVTELRSARR